MTSPTRHIEDAKQSSTLIVASIFFAVCCLFWIGLALTLAGTALTGLAQGNGLLFWLGIGLGVWLLSPVVSIGQWVFDWRNQLTKHYGVKFITATRREDTGADSDLVAAVENLAKQAELPATPAVGLCNEMNAYAVGFRQDKAAVVVGRPLMEHLSWSELRAVIGHEIGHIASRDMLASMMLMTTEKTVTQGLVRPVQRILGVIGVGTFTAGAMNIRNDAGMIMMLASAAVSLMLLPLRLWTSLFTWVMGLIQGLHSRRREFKADRIGAVLGSPDGMMSALETLAKTEDPNDVPATDTMRRFQIVDREVAMKGATGLFDSHPTTEQRLNALARFKRQLEEGSGSDSPA